jgi:hypothetical protein
MTQLQRFQSATMAVVMLATIAIGSGFADAAERKVLGEYFTSVF